jgi:hypothetical protein
MNPVHTLTSYFFEINNIVFPSTPKFSEWSLPFRFTDQAFALISHLTHACYITVHLTLYCIALIILHADHSDCAVRGVGLDRSDAGTVDSNPAQGLDVCPLFSMLCCPV